MKKELIQEYSKLLLNVYPKKYIQNCSYDYIVVSKEQDTPLVKNNILYINYQDFYQNYSLVYPIPAIRKPKKLLTYVESMDILQKMHYGTLAIQAEIPYCVSLNHFIVDGHIYFHCGRQGYKLNGLDKLACYEVVEDLGIHKEAFTNNHQSVIVYGTLKEITENKKALLDAFLQRYTPGFTKDFNEHVIRNTMILELEIIHINGKRHFH